MRTASRTRSAVRAPVALAAALLGAAVHLVGCASTPAPSVRAENVVAPSLRTTDVEVILTALPDSAPPGSDAEPRITAEIRTTTGLRRVLPRPVLGAVSWNAGAAVLTLEHLLVYERVDGLRREVARGVAAPATSSADRSRLAYAVRTEDDRFDVVVHDGSTPTIVARGLASAGAFRFSDDARVVAFVGAAGGGGIAGAWVARVDALDAAQCLTACDLRVGEPAILGGLASPLGAADFVDVSMSLVRWRDATGSVHDLAWEATP